MDDDDRAIFLERLLLLEEAYQKFKDLPPGKLYAECFSYLLNNMTVEINRDELIVGKTKEIIPSDQEEKIFLDKSRERSFSSLRLFSFDPLNLIEIKDVGLRYAPSWFNSWGHMTVSWEDLLKRGFQGIAEEAKNKIQELKNKKDKKKIAQKEFLECVIIVCNAMINLGERYAKKARELVVIEKSEKRKQELIQIAQICEKIPAKPAQTFWEALQSIWFVTLVLHCICGARDYGLGRFDMYLYPFYNRDIKFGELDKEKTVELLNAFLLSKMRLLAKG